MAMKIILTIGVIHFLMIFIDVFLCLCGDNEIWEFVSDKLFPKITNYIEKEKNVFKKYVLIIFLHILIPVNGYGVLIVFGLLIVIGIPALIIIGIMGLVGIIWGR